MKLKKKDQDELNEISQKISGYQSAIKNLSEYLGREEKKLWTLARKLAGDKEIKHITHCDKNSKIIIEDE